MKKIIVCLMFTFAIGYCLAGDVIIVANKASGLPPLTSDDVTKIFMGQKTSSGATKLLPATLSGGTTHAAFLSTYIRKTPMQYNTYWKNAVFTGQGLPPKVFNSEEELLRFIENTKGAIGYISAGTPHAGVAVVAIK